MLTIAQEHQNEHKEIENIKKNLELEAFRMASNSNVSFVKKIPKQFYDLYETSKGTIKSMYSNCIHTFFLLSKFKNLSLNIRTLVYKLGSNYYTNLDNIKEDKNKIELTKIRPEKALHLFCSNAAELFYKKNITNRSLMNETNTIKNNKLNLVKKESIFKDFNKSLNYLFELLDNEVNVDKIEDKNININELEENKKEDKNKMDKYLKELKYVKIPLPETRLRNSKGIIYKESKNRLGLPDSIQNKSDELKKKLKNIKRKEELLMGGHERLVDFERKKYLEAAIKRNSKLNNQTENFKQEKKIRCDCKYLDDCNCELLDIYGQVLGKPVSLKLEEELFNLHNIFDHKKNRENEIKYYKSLIKDKNNVSKKLTSPTWEVIIPLSSLSKLQLMTLEQLSGIELDNREKVNSIPQIKEINHEKGSKIAESVPINEDTNKEDGILRKKIRFYTEKYD